MRVVDALIEHITPAVSDFSLETNVRGHAFKAPKVRAGYLAEKKPGPSQSPPDFPYVIVRFLEDNDTDDSNIAQIRIIAGTYSQDEENGWRDALNVATRVKQHLLAHPCFDSAFRVMRPIRTELPEEQPFPEWVAMLTIHVQLPQVREEYEL